ncbi:MAG: peptide chain release factor N(5)-glutamine methyltransferase, partial [bacterium]|nr:peptide chain release factor N(5)-glutamine methyltransferase [bacterium]
MKIVELLEWGKTTLKKSEDPRFKAFSSSSLDAEVLLSSVLAISKAALVTRLTETVSIDQESLFRSFIERRLAHEPVAYITKNKYFFSRLFEVSQNVLIPRPETETLVEETIKMARLYEEHDQKFRFIDIGTGSGAIAITLAVETHKSVFATDISPEALEVATKNAITHHVENQVMFVQGNLMEPLLNVIKKEPTSHTIITANLPYLTKNQWEETQPEVKDWEPKLALEAGYYGLDVYWLLFRQLQQHRPLLGQSVVIFCEIDPAQDTKLPPLIQ